MLSGYKHEYGLLQQAMAFGMAEMRVVCSIYLQQQNQEAAKLQLNRVLDNGENDSNADTRSDNT